MKKISLMLFILASLCLIFSPLAYAEADIVDCIGGPEASIWNVDGDGDIVPQGTSDIGESDKEVAVGYFDALVLGGVSKESWGSVVSPWEDDGTTTTLTSAPTKFVLTHATGEVAATKLTAGTGDIALENDQTIDGGTNSSIIFGDNSDTMSVVFDGTDVQIETSDGGIIFDMNQADGSVDFMTSNDDDDYLQITTVGNEPLINSVGSCDLNITSSSGEIMLNDDNITTTGTIDAGACSLGAVTSTSLIIGDDTIDVVVDDQLRFASNDEESTIEAYGYEAKDGVLQLTADEGDDAGDKIQLVSDQATNSLLFTSDTAVKDTHATILTLAKTGALTTTGDVTAVNDSATTNAVQDIVKITSSSTGTPASGLGAGLIFHIEDLGGIEEQGSVDCVLTTETDGAEDAAIVFSQNTAGAIAETLRIQSASSGTVSDYLQFTANTTETDAVVDVMKLKIATGTAANNSGIGISFEPEDATGSEQHASIDIVQTTAARATNDTDFVFTQDVNGTLTERVRFDADGANILCSGATPNIIIGDAGAEDTKLVFDGNAQDFYVGLDDTADDLIIGLGSAVGTTPAISINEDQDVTLGAALVNSVDEITATSDGVAASVDTIVTEITTNDDDDLDNVTLANGVSGQIKHFVIAVSAAGDTCKITPATMLGGTQITFGDNGVGEGCTMIYLDDEGWAVIGNNGGTVA